MATVFYYLPLRGTLWPAATSPSWGCSTIICLTSLIFASDLMEPFRILVDREVACMPLEQFEQAEKMQLVDVLNREIKIDGRVQYVNNAIKIYCKSVFDALNEADSALFDFIKLSYRYMRVLVFFDLPWWKQRNSGEPIQSFASFCCAMVL